MPSNNFSEETQFDYLYDALAQKFPGIQAADGKNTVFQFMQTPLGANWKSGDDADAFELANSTSLDLGGFFMRGSSFANSYKDMVLSIEPTNGVDNPQYRDCVNKIAIIDNNLDSTRKQAQADYDLFKANHSEYEGTFEQWVVDPWGGKSWGDKLDELNVQRDNYATTQANVLAALDTALSQAQKEVNPWAQTMNITEGNQVREVPLITIGGDLQRDILSWNNRGEGDYDFDVIITKDQEITSPWKTTYTTTVKQKCLHTEVETNVNTSRIIADKNYKLRVTAVGANSYLINRGQWYHEDLASPETPIVEGSRWNSDSFFGLSGNLHLIPETIFVLYKPSIQLTISTQIYKQEFEEHADVAINWVDLLGFRFAFDGLASLQPEGDEVTTTVTFVAGSNQLAQIIGINSKVAWNGNTA